MRKRSMAFLSLKIGSRHKNNLYSYIYIILVKYRCVIFYRLSIRKNEIFFIPTEENSARA